MQPAPVILEGRHIRLELLTPAHHGPLCAAGLTGDVFRWFPSMVRNAEDMRSYIASALAAQQAGTELPFVTVERNSGTIVGSTRYMNIERAHRRLEIGSTWLAPAWQRTPANTEQKYLMLRHAFEQLGYLRVEFKTDSLNQRSRAALLRIGAKEEGTFRNHMIASDGRVRHSVYFSIVDSEWPGVKTTLEEKLVRPWTGHAAPPP